MLQDTLKSNSTCESELHNQHLCYIKSQGFHLTNEQEYKALVKDAKHMCNPYDTSPAAAVLQNARLCLTVPSVNQSRDAIFSDLCNDLLPQTSIQIREMSP